jgi:hypothetical protein
MTKNENDILLLQLFAIYTLLLDVKEKNKKKTSYN